MLTASPGQPAAVRGGDEDDGTGTSVRKVDDLVKALGSDTGDLEVGVSRIRADLDEQVAGFADRCLSDQAFPYVFLDATYCRRRSAVPATARTPGWCPRRSWSPPA
jgi:hypothetical protein